MLSRVILANPILPAVFVNLILTTYGFDILNIPEITIARKCCLKGTDWKLAFGDSVGIIEKILACVQRNTYSV